MKTVLVVDDNKMVLDFTVSFVREAIPNCRIITADDGFPALKIIKELPVDLIITDIEMPFCDGLGLIKSVRQSGSNIPIFVISASQRKLSYAMLLGANKIYEKGTGDVFTKLIPDIKAVLGD